MSGCKYMESPPWHSTEHLSFLVLGSGQHVPDTTPGDVNDDGSTETVQVPSHSAHLYFASACLGRYQTTSFIRMYTCFLRVILTATQQREETRPEGHLRAGK